MAFYISGPKLLFETTEISTQQESNYIYLYTMWLVIIIILDGFLHRNIWSKGFGGKSIFTSEVYTVFKVEYFLYITM
jgi:hypothetical protein